MIIDILLMVNRYDSDVNSKTLPNHVEEIEN